MKERLPAVERRPGDPANGITIIEARYESFRPGGAVIPLANLANQHVLDQLRKFYSAPNAAPSPARTAQVLAAERRRLEQAAHAKAAEQQRRAVLVPAVRQEAFVFIDESGDPGFRSLGDAYVYTAVIVPEAVLEAVRTDLRAILTRRWRGGAPRELHLHRVPPAIIDSVRGDLADVLQRHDLRAIAFVAPKWHTIKNLCRRHMEHRRSMETPMDFEWDARVHDPRYQFLNNFLTLTMEEVVSHLTLDFVLQGTAAHFRHDRKHVQWMNGALQDGFQRGVALGSRYAKETRGGHSRLSRAAAHPHVVQVPIQAPVAQGSGGN